MPAEASNGKTRTSLLNHAQKRSGAAVAAVRQHGSACRFGSRGHVFLLGKWQRRSLDKASKPFPVHGNACDEDVARLTRDDLAQVSGTSPHSRCLKMPAQIKAEYGKGPTIMRWLFRASRCNGGNA